MRKLSALIVGGMMLGLVGCGGSNPGGGTKTLFVKAQAESRGTLESSAIRVEVREGHSEGPVVSDAVVTVRGNETGEYNLSWSGITWGDFKAGFYGRDNLEWDTGWKIEVRRGDDGLDAYLEAPGTTTVMEPIGGTAFRRADGKPLVVKWKDSDGHRAQVATVDFQKSDGADRQFADYDDPFQVEIEPNILTPDSEKLEVRRKNEVKLEGGTPGSVFSAETKHQIEFVVE